MKRWRMFARLFGEGGYEEPEVSGKGRKPTGGGGECVERNCSTDDGVEGPHDAESAAGAAGGRKGDHPSDDFVARHAGGDVSGDAQGVPIFKDACRDFIHGGRSLAISGVAGTVLVALDFLDPSGPNEERVLGAFAAYFCGLWATVVADRWLYRRRQAVPPPDRFGDGRGALVMAAWVLWLSGVEAGELLAPWLAVAAILIGSFADGSWIFIVSSRRGVGFWRAWRELITGERAARRQCWTELFGEDRR